MPDEKLDLSREQAKSDLELRKLRAEIAKLTADESKAQLDIRELKNWWRRPAFLQPLATIIVTVGAGVVGYFNGYFSTKLESLKNQQAAVQQKIETLQSSRSEVQQRISGLTVELNSQREAFGRVSDEARRLEAKVKELGARSAEERAEKKRLLALLAEIRTSAARTAQPSSAQLPPGNGQVTGSTPATSNRGSEAKGVEWTGRVQSTDSKGLADVEITVPEPRFFKSMAVAVTDKDGKYTLRFPAHYFSNPTVNFRKEGYLGVTLSFTTEDLHDKEVKPVVMTKRPQ